MAKIIRAKAIQTPILLDEQAVPIPGGGHTGPRKPVRRLRRHYDHRWKRHHTHGKESKLAVALGKDYKGLVSIALYALAIIEKARETARNA